MRVSLAMAALVACQVPMPSNAAYAVDPQPPGPGMALTFDEEFSGTTLDATRWTTLHPDGYRSLPGNEELQSYADPSFIKERGLAPALDPFEVKDGALRVTARHLEPGDALRAQAPFLSGMITTFRSFPFLFGYVEVRASFPEGDGLWPAIWLMRPGSSPYAETDIAEVLGDRPERVYATVHHGTDWSTRRMDQATYDKPRSEGFHVYGMNWNVSTTTIYVDGVQVGSFPTAPESRAPMYLIVNLAVGGKWGKPPRPEDFPKTLVVDYVRIWQSK